MIKPRVAVIFGGTNTEHEVSLLSAKAILDNLDKSRFEIVPIKITKDNKWVPLKLIESPQIRQLETAEKKHRLGNITTKEEALSQSQIDVVFPVLHGPFGEDGTIQGLLELLRIPYVGCGVTASAVCMDKVIQKNICNDYQIPIAPFFWLTNSDWEKRRKLTLEKIQDKFHSSFPLFVKPANQGSSVGITKVHNETELNSGIEIAFKRDIKVIIEEGIPNAREIECSILGNDEPMVSLLGEIIPGNEFYDYNAKYIDNNSIPIIPANVSKELSNKIRSTALRAFQVLDCAGMARIDFLINRKTNEYFLNEVNTIPGFTPISMYPKLWEASGIPYKDLLTKIIKLGIERNKARSKINFAL